MNAESYVAGPWQDYPWPNEPGHWQAFHVFPPGSDSKRSQAIFDFACTIPVIKDHYPFLGCAPAPDFLSREIEYPRRYGIFLRSWAFRYNNSIDNARQAIQDFEAGWIAAEKAYTADVLIDQSKDGRVKVYRKVRK